MYVYTHTNISHIHFYICIYMFRYVHMYIQRHWEPLGQLTWAGEACAAGGPAGPFARRRRGVDQHPASGDVASSSLVSLVCFDLAPWVLLFSPWLFLFGSLVWFYMSLASKNLPQMPLCVYGSWPKLLFRKRVKSMQGQVL